MNDKEVFDTAVVGGGAAGYYGAITLTESRPEASVVLLERSRRVLQKVKISGGGRCNVTHNSFDPKWMATNYPRGSKALIGPFHKYCCPDIVQWFSRRGVKLKAEDDGRMFPTTDDSQTIIDCLRGAADDGGVELRTRAGVEAIVNRSDDGEPLFELICEGGDRVWAKRVLLATGGTRSGSGASIAKSLGHELKPPVPSLFTFNIEDKRLKDLQGISLESVSVRAPSVDLSTSGPMVVTHWGLSGPAILKLSAWGARKLYEVDYEFELLVNWLPGVDVAAELKRLVNDDTWKRRQILTRSPFDELPKRLWRRLAVSAGVKDEVNWAECPKKARTALVEMLTAMRFQVSGQSVNKDEFVTCGGVTTDEVDMRTMESRLTPGVYFAGELLDIDGVTGGFNFQSAWTTGYLAGRAIADSLQ